MAIDTNICIFTGYLGADPEVRFMGDGTPVCNFRIAVNGYKDSVLWLRCNVWGKTAEACGQYLAKGSFVRVAGELQVRPWTDKEGRERESWELRCSNFGGVQFLDKRGQGGGGGDLGPPPPRHHGGGSDVPF